MLNRISLSLFHNEQLISLILLEVLILLAAFLIYRKIGRKENKNNTWTIQDTFLCAAVCLAFFIAGVWKLGVMDFPVTSWTPHSEINSFTLEITDAYTASDRILILTSEVNEDPSLEDFQLGLQGVNIEGSNDLENWDPISTLEKGSFQQYTIVDGQFNYRYLRFTSGSIYNVITEIAVKRAGFNELLPLKLISGDESAERVIDEQDLVVCDPTYEHQTYFDEIYHVRNAVEIAYGYPMYAFVHPLLGTQIIAASIRLLGNNPFAWRIPGVIFSTAIVALMYEMGRILFHRRFFSVLSALFMALDFMHMTTGRIATLEPFSIFFILLMTYFMIRYLKSDQDPQGFRKGLLWLMLSGIAMGIGVSVKWTGAYAGVGLAVLFFAHQGRQIHQYFQIKKKQVTTEKEKESASLFVKHTVITLLWCCVFFVAVPLIIYACSFMPCQIVRGQSWSIQGVIDQTVGMFDYHANLNATHPFQSVWWQWILDLRPIWYYFHETPHAVYTISAMGHPLLWWSGLAAVIYCVIDSIRTGSKTAWMIVIGYFAQLLPWMLVQRCVFIYHYYPSVPFLLLALVYGLKKLIDKDHRYEKRIRIFVLVCIVLFVLFLPVICGFATTHEYINGFLRWFESWYFG